MTKQPTPPKSPRRPKRPKVSRQRLSREAEHDLIRRSQRGDRAAGDVLLHAYSNFIGSIVAPVSRRTGLDHEDMMQEGRIGFMVAVKRFKFSLGVELATYAPWWIRACLRTARLDGRPIRLPAWADEVMRTAARLGIDSTRIENLVDAGLLRADSKAIGSALCTTSTVSLDRPMRSHGDAGDGGTFIDALADDGPLPDEIVERDRFAAFAREEIQAVVSTLRPRYQVVLRLRALAKPGKELTLEELGSRLGITRQAVQQIESRALAEVRLRVRARAAERDARLQSAA